MRRDAARSAWLPGVSRVARVLLAVVLAGLIVTGTAVAASVPGTVFAPSLERQLTRDTKVEATSVRCPKRVEVRDGRTFDCVVRFASGDRGPVRVTLRGTRGRYGARLVNLMMRHIEDQLEEALDGAAQVTCPPGRRIRRGDRFTCTARADGDRSVLRVRQLGDGRVTYLLA